MRVLYLIMTLIKANNIETNLEKQHRRKLEHRSQELNTLKSLANQLQQCNCEEDGSRSKDILKLVYR